MALTNLSGQRIGRPEPTVRWHDIHVAQQDERRLVPSLEAGPDVAASRCRLGNLVGNAFLLQNRLEKLGSSDLVPRRVRRVDAQVAPPSWLPRRYDRVKAPRAAFGGAFRAALTRPTRRGLSRGRDEGPAFVASTT